MHAETKRAHANELFVLLSDKMAHANGHKKAAIYNVNTADTFEDKFS